MGTGESFFFKSSRGQLPARLVGRDQSQSLAVGGQPFVSWFNGRMGARSGLIPGALLCLTLSPPFVPTANFVPGPPLLQLEAAAAAEAEEEEWRAALEADFARGEAERAAAIQYLSEQLEAVAADAGNRCVLETVASSEQGVFLRQGIFLALRRKRGWVAECHLGHSGPFFMHAIVLSCSGTRACFPCAVPTWAAPWQ